MTLIDRVKASMLATGTDVTMWGEGALTELAIAAIRGVYDEAMHRRDEGELTADMWFAYRELLDEPSPVAPHPETR